MTTYVYSINAHATLVHIGGRRRTVCGIVIVSAVETHDLPADRAVCSRCVGLGTAYGIVTVDEAALLVRHRPTVTTALPTAILDLLKRGEDNATIALTLHLGLRTVVRRCVDAMERAGAQTRSGWRRAAPSGRPNPP
jgi:hypothetical protein